MWRGQEGPGEELPVSGISPGGLPGGEGGLAEGEEVGQQIMVISNVSRWSEIPAASGAPGPRIVRLKLVGESENIHMFSP